MNVKTRQAGKKNSKMQDQPEKLSINDTIVAQYLSQRPDFFQDKPQLLEKMQFTHASGDAISLIERQVELLRQQNSELNKQLNDLFRIAKENEKSSLKMHQLILALLGCKNIADIAKVLEQEIIEQFNINMVALKFFSNEKLNLKTRKTLGLDENSDTFRALKKITHKRTPVCGYFPQLQPKALLPVRKQKMEVGSMAVMPLYVDKNICFAALILGSEDKNHFSPNNGSLFLKHLAEIVSISIHKYL